MKMLAAEGYMDIANRAPYPLVVLDWVSDGCAVFLLRDLKIREHIALFIKMLCSSGGNNQQFYWFLAAVLEQGAFEACQVGAVTFVKSHWLFIWDVNLQLPFFNDEKGFTLLKLNTLLL